MKIATAKKKTSKNWVTEDISWEALLNRLRSTYKTAETLREYKAMTRDEKDRAKGAKGGFVGGALSCGQRKSGNVVSRSLITLDADNAYPGQWDNVTTLHEFTMCCYSTHSSTLKSPRLRWVIPTDRDMTPDEYPAVARRVAEWFGIHTFDKTTFEVARLMYFPTTPADQTYEWHEQGGNLLSVDAVLHTYGQNDDAWKDTTQWPICPDEREIIVNRHVDEKRAVDPTLIPGIVGLFCRTYDIPAAIDSFLSDVYADCGNGRYTYIPGSSAAGAIVYNDGAYLYSNHATDPCGGMSVNSFNLVRIHKFGDMDDQNENENDVPFNRRPSYLKMKDWVSSLPEVKAQIATEAQDAAKLYTGDLASDADNYDPDDMSWTEALEVNNKTGAYEDSQFNANLILTHDKNLRNICGLDMMSRTPKLLRPVPWRSAQEVKPRQTTWEDLDDTGVRGYLQKQYNFQNDKNWMSALMMVQYDNRFHPIRDYLSALEWDGKKRLDTMLEDYFGVEDSPYTRAVSRKWMTAAVSRVMCPGCKFDCVLVLYGKQGIGKSTFADILAKEQWSTPSAVDMGNKSGYETIQGKWIIELAELSSMKRSDLETVKSFISSRADTYREAYGRRSSTKQRECVFFATTNELEFLKDRTGGRRFWPVNATKRLDFQLLRDNVDQLWAEAVVRYKEHEYLDLETEEQMSGWSAMVGGHEVQDPFVGQLVEFLDRPIKENWEDMEPEDRRRFLDDRLPGEAEGTVRRDAISICEVRVEMLGQPRNSIGNDLDARRISNVLNSLPGWEKVKNPKTIKGYGVQRYYRRNDEGKQEWNDKHCLS